MKINFLHPYGHTASSYARYIVALQSSTPAKVSVNTATGCTHTLTNEETKLTAKRSKTYICNFR
jgi:hypothetical protein